MDTTPQRQPAVHAEGHPPDPAVRKDPVCGMGVTVQSAHQVVHEGRTFYFCSAHCQGRFEANPRRYTAPAPAPAPSPPQPLAADGTVYTCPMHPHIRQDHPGNCPLCGMWLEPVMPEPAGSDNPEFEDLRRRFWWTLPLTVTVAVLAMSGHRLGWIDRAVQSWVELVLSVPIVLWAGWPFFVRGVQSVLKRSPNMWTLIGLGTGAAFVYSTVATVAPQVFPRSFVSMGRVEVYFEAAAVIISLTLLGQLMELKARSQTSAAIRSLLNLAPRPHGASPPTGRKKTSRWAMCTWATCCACAPAKRSPPTVP
jgi:Cu+-exporting ATPase